MNIGMPKVKNCEDVLHYVTEQELYLLLRKQIAKDFEKIQQTLAITPTTEPSDLKALVTEKVYFLLMERFPEYLNLMYSVDIRESYFKHLKITDTVAVAEQVTFLILRRCLEKVLYKRHYQQKG